MKGTGPGLSRGTARKRWRSAGGLKARERRPSQRIQPFREDQILPWLRLLEIMKISRAARGFRQDIPRRASSHSYLLLLLLAVPAQAALAESPENLVRDAAYNEAQAHAQPVAWEYRVDKLVEGKKLTEEQIDTKYGPVYRLLAVDGKPLDAAQQATEAARVHKLQTDTRLQQKALDRHKADEQRLSDLLALLPKAFLFNVKSVNGDEETLGFHPNPKFHSQSYELRVMRALEGELVINTREKRIAHLNGMLAQQVSFGFGILGRIDKGGVFEIGRLEVTPGVWKTTLIRIQVAGQFSFFATISKQEYEVRSNFIKLPDGITVPEAYAMLDKTQ